MFSVCWLSWFHSEISTVYSACDIFLVCKICRRHWCFVTPPTLVPSPKTQYLRSNASLRPCSLVKHMHQRWLSTKFWFCTTQMRSHSFFPVQYMEEHVLPTSRDFLAAKSICYKICTLQWRWSHMTMRDIGCFIVDIDAGYPKRIWHIFWVTVNCVKSFKKCYNLKRHYRLLEVFFTRLSDLEILSVIRATYDLGNDWCITISCSIKARIYFSV